MADGCKVGKILQMAWLAYQ